MGTSAFDVGSLSNRRLTVARGGCVLRSSHSCKARASANTSRYNTVCDYSFRYCEHVYYFLIIIQKESYLNEGKQPTYVTWKTLHKNKKQTEEEEEEKK